MSHCIVFATVVVFVLPFALMLTTLQGMSTEYLPCVFAVTGLTALAVIGCREVTMYICRHLAGQRQDYWQDQAYLQRQVYDQSQVDLEGQIPWYDQGRPEGQIQWYDQGQCQVRNRSRGQNRSERQCYNRGQDQNRHFCECDPVTRNPNYCRNVSLGQSQSSCQGQNRTNSVRITICTCDETACRQHDPILLNSLSKYISNPDLLYNLGIALQVGINAIDSCKHNNMGSINQAALAVLHDWYQTQDGLGLQSQGLKDLKKALVEINRATWVTTVIENHFQRR